MTAVRGASPRSAPAIETSRWQQSPAAASLRSTETPVRPNQANGTDRMHASSDGNGRHPARRPSTASFAKGQDIFHPGEGQGQIYIVRTGYVRLFKVLPDKRSINLGLLGPNTVFAQEDVYDGLSTGATAQALVDSTVSIVDAEDLAGLIAESPDLAVAVVHGMNRRLTELQTLVEHLLLRDTAVRLVTALYTLAKGFGRQTADGMTAITLPLTHQALANMIGSNRVTVTRKLIDLQRDGLVRSLGRNAIAVNPDRLREYAHSAGSAS